MFSYPSFRGVLGHAHVDDKPWLKIDETVTGLTAEIVGMTDGWLQYSTVTVV